MLVFFAHNTEQRKGHCHQNKETYENIKTKGFETRLCSFPFHHFLSSDDKYASIGCIYSSLRRSSSFKVLQSDTKVIVPEFVYCCCIVFSKLRSNQVTGAKNNIVNEEINVFLDVAIYPL